jgi:hypothetical protein
MLAVLAALVTLPTAAALAQTIGYGAQGQVIIHAVKVHHAKSAADGQALALLASLSADAGIPFFAKPEEPTARARLAATRRAEADPALCIRAGVSVNPAVMSGPQMTLEHGLVGCPTNTAGLPVILVQDPTLEPPPTSRTGEYNLDVTMRYRLLEQDHVQLMASLTEQALSYSMDSPITGNNLLAALTMMF